ncbi:MAG: PKD domain-containing protein [Bacteroidales bacterium]|nr:PKD domain-containing protein [Bacteroidales bacterium]
MTIAISPYCVLEINAQPTAGFDVVVAEGCVPFTAEFINHSTPSVGLTYQWSFGDENFSEVFEPIHVYYASNNYTVSLIVSDGENYDTLTIPDFIVVRDKPSPDFTISQGTIGCLPYEVEFTDASTGNGANIVDWRWNFGDGIISTDQNPTHTYEVRGEFDVTLRVTDDFGCESNIIIQDFIHVFKPEAGFMASSTESCSGTLTATFTNTSEGELPLQYLWSFGDGEFASLENPTHTYDSSGMYDVQLIASDVHGCSDTIIRPDYIEIIRTRASFTFEKDVYCRDEQIRFENNSENADTYNWVFGDIGSSTQAEPTYVFTESGNYPVSLTVGYLGICSHTFTDTITIDNIEANFSSSVNFGCSVPLNVSYTDHSIGAVAWNYQFGNGTTSTLKNPSTTYNITEALAENQQEQYFNALTVTSSNGCRDSLIIENNIEIALPNALFIGKNEANEEKLNGCIPLALSFTDASSYTTNQDSIVSWNWNFDNGITSTEKNPEIIYDASGIYDILLTITTELGCMSQYQKKAQAGIPQNPDFEITTPSVTCASNAVQFNNLSTNRDSIDAIFWDFGDGVTSLDDNPFNYYTDTGYMDVTLWVYHKGCGRSKTINDIVYINGPVSYFTLDFDCSDPYTYTFSSKIIDATSISWNLGDGSPSVLDTEIVEHTYNTKGQYYIILRADNDNTGCISTYRRIIKVVDITPDFVVSHTIGCPDLEVSFNSSATVDEVSFNFNNERGRYLWIFDDDETMEITEDTVISHVYKKRGTYFPALVVRDKDRCYDTLCKQIKIYQPQPDFDVNHELGCMPMFFSFSNLTQTDTTIASWLWNFGNDSTSDLQDPIYEYTEYGNYDISLTATDVLGCQNTKKKQNLINAVRADPNFIASDTQLCIGDTIQLMYNGNSNVASYEWEIELNDPPGEEIVQSAFPLPGYFSPSLKITDVFGCDSTLTREDYIHVQDFPTANFTEDATSSNCYPFEISFTNTSTSEDLSGRFIWTFDDLGHSIAKNPVFSFNKPGVFDVQLVAFTTYGCTDTLLKMDLIDIGGPSANVIMPDTTCYYRSNKLYLNEKMNIYRSIWDLGDGTSAEGDTVYHTYTRKGYVPVNVLLMSDANNTCNKYSRDTIYIFEFDAGFLINDNMNKGCVPFTVEVTDTTSRASLITWFFGDFNVSQLSNTSHTYDSSGLFELLLVAKNAFGCSDSATHNIEVFPLPKITIVSDTFICLDDNVRLQAMGGTEYWWEPYEFVKEPDSPFTTAMPDTTTRFEVSVTDSNNCVNTDSVLVVVQQYPRVNLADTAIIIGELIYVDVTSDDILSYNWYPDVNITCTDCPNPILQPLENITYTVTVEDTSHCFVLDYDYNIEIIKAFTLDLPDAFTPNNDGINDIAYVKGWGIKALEYLKIYNRYGELVFETSDINEGWDGIYKGKTQTMGAYLYYIKAITFQDSIIEKQGYIRILR